MKVSLKELRKIINNVLLEAEKDLMLDEPGMIVEPDVRSAIKKYFKSMGLSTTHDKPGKKWS